MSGADLRGLRYGFAMNSARRLARRLGCHPSTIWRNEHRARISTFLLVRIDGHQTAAAFARGQMEGESWKKSQ